MSSENTPLASNVDFSSNASYVADTDDIERCILLFSGGLDTSCMVHWLTNSLGCRVHTLTVDVGQREDFDQLENRARQLGAVQHHYVDARKEFVEDFCWRAIKADAVISRFGHPLSSSLTRPLMTRTAVGLARANDIGVIAHGASGRANDSLRIDLSVLALAPDMKVLAPVRELGMTRTAELEYARQNDIQITATPERSHSVDDNLWARETEAGGLDDLEEPAPDCIFSPSGVGLDPRDVTVRFENGTPVALDGEFSQPLDIINRLSEIAGGYAIGRFDCMEDRGVGIKVREIHEAPAAAVLLRAHAELTALALTREELRLADIVQRQWVDSALNGFWFTPLMRAMNAFLDSLNARVEGEVVLRLSEQSMTVRSRTSPYSLDLSNLARRGHLQGLNERATAPFIEVVGLQQRASQWLAGADSEM